MNQEDREARALNGKEEFQIVDVVDMMQPLTKYTRQISSAHNIPARVREAFRRAEDERPVFTKFTDVPELPQRHPLAEDDTTDHDNDTSSE